MLLVPRLVVEVTGLPERFIPRAASIESAAKVDVSPKRGGIGLADGYFGDDEKTARAFVYSEALGERVYRTGDMGRHLPSGDVEILGRIDFQVKVNGFRVEIGEVEAGLRRAERVKDAVVLPVGPKGRQRLLGYVLVESDADATSYE